MSTAIRDTITPAHTKAMKLQAMLAHSFGGSGEAFRDMEAEHQDTYLWLCKDLADSIVDALESSLSKSGGVAS